jgi:hypothetical protein
MPPTTQRERSLSYTQTTNDSFGKVTNVTWVANGYNALGQLLGYTETGHEQNPGVATRAITTNWFANFADSYTDHGVSIHNKTITVRNDVGSTDQQTTTREWSNATYIDHRLQSYLDLTQITRKTDAGEDTSKSTVIRQSTDYYTAPDADKNARKGMLKGYRELQIGSGASLKPSQVIVDNLAYDTRGRQSESQTVTADEDLTGALLRRLTDWLGDDPSTRLTLIGAIELASLLLKFSMAAADPTPGALVAAWLDENMPAADADSLTFIKSIITRLALAIENPIEQLETTVTALIDDITAAWTTLSTTVSEMKAKVLSVFDPSYKNATETDNLPAVFLTSDAYKALRPFDYSLSVTQKTITAWDHGRPTKWTENTRSSAAKDKTIESQVEVTYEGETQRQATYSARIHETGTDGEGNPLDKVSHLFRKDFIYDGSEQATAFVEMSFDGDSLTVDGVSQPWSGFSGLEKANFLNGLMDKSKEVMEIVNVNEYKNVQYSPTGQMKDFDLTTHKFGFTYQGFSELGSVSRSLSDLNAMIALQNARVTEAQTAYLDRFNEWTLAVAKAKTDLGIDLPDASNVELVKNQVIALFNERFNSEGSAQKEMRESSDLLDTARGNLSIAYTNLIAADENFDAERGKWLLAANDVQNWVDKWETENQTDMNLKVQSLEEFAGYSYVSEEVKTDTINFKFVYGEFLAAMTDWETEFTSAKEKMDQWNWNPETDDLTTARLTQLATWAPLSSLSDLNTKAQKIANKLTDLQAKGTLLNTSITTLIDAPTTGLEAIKNQTNTEWGAAGTALNGDGTPSNVGSRSKLFNASVALKENLKAFLDGKTTEAKNAYDVSYGPTSYIGQVQTSGVIGVVTQTYRFYYMGAFASQVDFEIKLIPVGDNARFEVKLLNPTAHHEFGSGYFFLDSPYSGVVSRNDIQSKMTELINKKWLRPGYRSIGTPQINDLLIGSTLGDSSSRPTLYVNALTVRDTAYTNWQTYKNQSDAVESETNLGNELSMARDSTGAIRAIGNDHWDFAVENGFSNAIIGDGFWAKYLSAQNTRNQDEIKEASTKSAYELANNHFEKAKEMTDTTLNSLLSSIANLSASLSPLLADTVDDGIDNPGLQERTTSLVGTMGIVQLLKETGTTWDTAQGTVDTRQADFDMKYKSHQSALDLRISAEEAQRNLDARSGYTNDAQNDIVTQQTELSRLQSESVDFRNRAVNVLKGTVFQLDTETVTLTESQAVTLTSGGTVSLAGHDRTLAELVSDPTVRIKVSAAETRTVARRDVAYDGRGLTSSYNELSFTGTRLSVPSISGAPLDWTSLTRQQQKDILSGDLPAELIGDGALIVTYAKENHYNTLGQVDRQVIETHETRRKGAETHTTIRQTATQNMVYDILGNLARYKRVTMEYPSADDPESKGKLTFEETRDQAGDANILYNPKNLMRDVRLQITEMTPAAPLSATDSLLTPSATLAALLGEGFGGPEALDGTQIFKKTTFTRTLVEDFNDLDQALRVTRTTIDGDKATVTTSLADMKYNEQGQVTYDRSRQIETSPDDLSDILSNLTAIRAIAKQTDVNLSDFGAEGKVTDSETWGQTYTGAGLLLSFVRSTSDGKKTTQESTAFEYENAKVSRSTSDLLETGTPTDGMGRPSLYFRVSHVVTDGFLYNPAGQAKAYRRTTTVDGKTTEENVSRITYDPQGRLLHSLTAFKETTVGVAVPHEYTVDLTIHGYDPAGRIARQTRITLDRNKKTTESNEDPSFAEFSYDPQDRLTNQTMRVREVSVTASGDETEAYEKIQIVTQLFTYDEVGQVSTSRRVARRYDAATDRTSVIDESNTYLYDMHGRAIESGITKVDGEFSGDQRMASLVDLAELTPLSNKVTSSVTLVPVSGFEMGRMVRFSSVNFEGDHIRLLRMGSEVSLTWKELTDGEKRDVVAGTLRSALRDTVIVTSMADVEYNSDGQMTSWTSRSRAMVFIPADKPVKLGELIGAAFAAEGVTEEKILADTALYLALFQQFFGNGTLRLTDGTIVQVSSLTDDQRLALLLAVEGKTNWTYVDKIVSPDTLDIFNISLDHTTSSLRADTVYDGLGQVQSFDELSVDGNGLVVNRSWTPLKNGASLSALLSAWNELDGESEIPSDRVTELQEMLPNTLVTWTKNYGMKYNKLGQAYSWNTEKRELSLSVADILARKTGAPLRLTTNTLQTSNRLETAYKGGQEWATKEINPGPQGETTTWTFFNYTTSPSGSPRASGVLRIIKDKLNATDEVQWNAEYTNATAFESFDSQEAYKQIEVTRSNRITMKISELEGEFKKFADARNGSDFSSVMADSFEGSSETTISTDRTVFTYDTIAYGGKDIPRLAKTLVYRTAADGVENMEETNFHYSSISDLKPDRTQTVTVLNPTMTLGSDGLWAYVPQTDDFKTVEEATLTYNSQQQVAESLVHRLSPGGGETLEHTVYGYDLSGRVESTDKEITIAGQLTREITINEFDFRRLSRSRVFTQKPEGFTTAELNEFQYDKFDHISYLETLTIEGVATIADKDRVRLQTNKELQDYNFSTAPGPRTRTIRDNYTYAGPSDPTPGLATAYWERVETNGAPGKLTLRYVHDALYDGGRRMDSSITEEMELRGSLTDFETGLSAHLHASTSNSIYTYMASSDMADDIITQKRVTIQAGIPATGPPAEALLESFLGATEGYDDQGRMKNLTRTTEERGYKTTEWIHHTFNDADGRILASHLLTKKVAVVGGIETLGILNKLSEEIVSYQSFDVANRVARVLEQVRVTLEGDRRVQEDGIFAFNGQGLVSRSQITTRETSFTTDALNHTFLTVTEAKEGDGFENGRMRNFTRTTIDEDLVRKEVISNASYDSWGQILHSESVVTEKGASSGTTLNHETTVTTDNTYDTSTTNLGRLTNVTRVVNDQKKKTIEEIEFTNFDDQNHILLQTSNFTEEDTFDETYIGAHPEDDFLKKYAVVTAYSPTDYNSLGQAVGWTRTTTDKNSLGVAFKNTTETVSGATFDQQGRLSNMTSTAHELSLVSGNPLNLTSTIITSMTYNRLGLALTQTRRTEPLGGGKVTIEGNTGMTYTPEGRLKTSLMVINERSVAAPGVEEGAVLNATQTIETTLNTYDLLGRASRIERTTTEGGKTTTETIEGMVYFKDGLLNASMTDQVETSALMDPTYTRVFVGDTEYNPLGQTTAYKRTSRLYKNADFTGIKKEVSELISGVNYGTDARVIGQTSLAREKVFDESAALVTGRFQEIVTSEQTYNVLGQLAQGVTLTRDFSLEDLDNPDFILISAVPIVTTTELTQADSTYDVNGRLFSRITLKVEIGADVKGDMVRSTVNETLGMEYNDAGQTVRFVRATTEFPDGYPGTLGKRTEETTKEDILYDKQGRIQKQVTSVVESGAAGDSVLNHTTVQTLYNKAFDSADRVTDATQITRETDGSHPITVENTGMTYDSQGRVLSYVRLTQDGSRAPIVREETLADNQYNKLGRLLESKVRTTDGERVLETETTNSFYDLFGRVKTYDRTTTEYDSGWVSGALPIKQTRESTNAQLEYNGLGQIFISNLHFHEISKIDSLPMDREYDLKTTSTKYDLTGRVARQERVNTDRNKVTTETSTSDTLYDSNGRVASSASSVHEYVRAGETVLLDHTFQTRVISSLYNDKNWLTFQTRERDDFGKTVREDVTTDGWDALGRTTHQTVNTVESSPDLYHGFQTDLITEYNKLGQALSSKTILSKDSGALERLVESQRSGMTYDALGRLIFYTDYQYSNAAPDRATTIDRTVKSFDKADRMTSWEDKQKQLLMGADGKPVDLEQLKDLVLTAGAFHNYTTASGIPLDGMTFGDFLAQAASGMNDESGRPLTGINAQEVLRTLLTQALEAPMRDTLGPSYTDALREVVINTVLAQAVPLLDLNGKTLTSLSAGPLLYSLLQGYLTSYTTLTDATGGSDAIVGFSPVNLADGMRDQNGVLLSEATVRSVLTETLDRAFRIQGLTPAQAMSAATSLVNGSALAELTLVTDLTDSIPVLDAKLSELSGALPSLQTDRVNALTSMSIGEILFNNVFASASAATIDTLLNTVFGGDLSAYTLKDGTGVGGLTFSQILLKMLGGGTDLLATVKGALASAFSDYEKKIATNITVSRLDFDLLSRPTFRQETKTWQSLGGGGIPGLDSGWRNATAEVTTQMTYQGATDRLGSQSVRATGAGNYVSSSNTPIVNDWFQSLGINHYFLEGDFNYDLAGRQVRSTTLIVAPLSYTGYYFDTDWTGKKKPGPSVEGARGLPIATKSITTNLGFDSLGRPVSTRSDWMRDDGNLSQGWTVDSNTYNAEGIKKAWDSKGVTTVSEPGNADNFSSLWQGPTANYVLANWDHALSLAGGIGGLWDASRGGGEVTANMGNSGQNRAVYDAYGNLDDAATRAASTITTSVDYEGAGGGFGDIITAVTMVVAVALTIMTAGGASPLIAAAYAGAIAAGQSLINSAVNGVKFGKALLAAGIAGVSAFATSFFAPGGTGSKLDFGTKVLINVATNALANVATSYLVMGVRNPSDLWRTAAAGAVSGLMPSGQGNSTKIVGHALIASALNVAAARIEGVRSGKQLLLVGGLSAAAAYVSSQFSPKDTPGGKTFSKLERFGMALGGAILGVGVGRVIGNNVSGASGQALAGFAATLAAQISLSNGQLSSGKNGAKEFQSQMPEATRAFGQALKGGIQAQNGHKREQRVQIFVQGPGIEDVKAQSRREERKERSGLAYQGLLLDSAITLAQNPMGLASFLTGGFVSVLTGMPGALLSPVQTIKDGYSSSTPSLSLSVVFKDNTSKTFSNDDKPAALLSALNREDVAYVMISSKEGQPSVELTREEIKAAVEAIQGVKLDIGALKEFGEALEKSIVAARADGLNVDQVVGIRINDKAMALLIDNEKGIVGTLTQNALGQNELRTYSFTLEGGKVVKAEGKVLREINGKFEQTGTFELLRGGRATAEVQKFTKEHVINQEIVALLADTKGVYSERDMAGQLVRRVFLGENKNGETVALASEHATYNNEGKATGYFLRTYEYADAGLSSSLTKGGEIVAKGKVFDQSAEGVYSEKTRAEFEIARLTGSALVKAEGTAGALAAALSLGGHQGGLLVYQEKDTTLQKITQTVIMDEKSGALKAVSQTGQDGKTTVTVFNRADMDKISADMGEVRYLGDMTKDEQTHFQNSIAVMGKHDSALLTEVTAQMQESLMAAMAVKKLGEAFGMDTKDVFLALAEGMAAELGLPKGTILNVTNMRMDQNNEVILEGTLTGKDLKAEKKFILVGSASAMATALGQKNDTKGAQLLLIQEEGGYRAVTYVPDGDTKGGVRVLSNPQELLNSGLVRDTVKAARVVGGFGDQPGVMERVTETAAETTKKAAESIPGAKTILKKLAPESKETKPARPTEKLEEKPSPKSLFEQLLPFFEKNPGSPLPMPRGMNPLKVNGNALDKLYANAKDVLGAWDFSFMSAPDDEPAADKTPITVALANVQPADAPIGPTSVKPTATVAPAKAVEPAPTAARIKPAKTVEAKPLDTTATIETPEKKGFFARMKETVSSYKEDLKTVVGFVKDETVAFCQDTVETLVDAKDAAVDVALDVAAKAQDVSLTVGNFEHGLKKGLTGKSPVPLSYDQEKGDWYRNDVYDPFYRGYEGARNTGYEIGDYVHDRGLDFVDMFKANVLLGPGIKGEIAFTALKSDFKVVAGGAVGNKYGFDGRKIIGEAYGRGEVGIKAGPYQIKPRVSLTKDLIGQGREKTEFTWGIRLGERDAGKIGNVKLKGDIHIKENLNPEVGVSGQGGMIGGELKFRPLELIDFVSGFIGNDFSNDDNQRAVFGAPQPYRTYLRTENGQPYLLNQSGKGASEKREEVPGLFVRFVGLSSSVAQGVGKVANDAREAGTNILNAGWQWTADVSRNAATNIHTAAVLYRDDMRTVAGAAIGAVKDVGEFTIKKANDGWNWSKERASAIAEPYSRNVSASFNEMTRADPVTANKLAIGMVASVFSGDIWDESMPIVFDKHGPAVITINGIMNTGADAIALRDAVGRSFGVEKLTMVANNTHTKGLQDGLQVAFQEYFGAIDAPSVQTAIAIRQGIKEKGEVFVVAHSQGTAIFDAALDLLSTAEKAHIHYLGLGPEKYVSDKMEGLADAENVRNEGDIVPLLGNTAKASNWLIPTEWPRKVSTVWTNIDRNVPGNRHGFEQFYKQEVKRWTKERDQ